MEISVNNIRQRLKKFYSSHVAGKSSDQDFLSQLIQDMAKLSYTEINRLRSEFEPNWFLPEWYDQLSNECHKAQREKYYAELAIKFINRECGVDFQFRVRPEEQGGTETHDFDYGDSKTGKMIALEVVRLLELDKPGTILHPRPISNLINFWKRVESGLSEKLVGVYYVTHCPLLQNWKSLDGQCAQEILKLAPSIPMGQTGILNSPDELRGTFLFKQSEDGCAFILGSIGFTGYTGPINNSKALSQFKDKILPEKDDQLEPAKKNDKITLLLVVLDYPLLDSDTLAKVFQESTCPHIDHVLLVHSWAGGSKSAKIEKVV